MNQSKYAPLNSFSINQSKNTKSKMSYKKQEKSNFNNNVSSVGQGYVSFDADQSHDSPKAHLPKKKPMKGIKIYNSGLRLDESNPSPIRKSEFVSNMPFE